MWSNWEGVKKKKLAQHTRCCLFFATQQRTTGHVPKIKSFDWSKFVRTCLGFAWTTKNKRRRRDSTLVIEFWTWNPSWFWPCRQMRVFSYSSPINPCVFFSVVMNLRVKTSNCITTFFLAAKYCAQNSGVGSFQALLRHAWSFFEVVCFQRSYCARVVLMTILLGIIRALGTVLVRASRAWTSLSGGGRNSTTSGRTTSFPCFCEFSPIRYPGIITIICSHTHFKEETWGMLGLACIHAKP